MHTVRWIVYVYTCIYIYMSYVKVNKEMYLLAVYEQSHQHVSIINPSPWPNLSLTNLSVRPLAWLMAMRGRPRLRTSNMRLLLATRLERAKVGLVQIVVIGVTWCDIKQAEVWLEFDLQSWLSNTKNMNMILLRIWLCIEAHLQKYVRLVNCVTSTPKGNQKNNPIYVETLCSQVTHHAFAGHPILSRLAKWHGPFCEHTSKITTWYSLGGGGASGI